MSITSFTYRSNLNLVHKESLFGLLFSLVSPLVNLRVNLP